MLSKLNFYKEQIIDFCNNRSLFILKDFDKIPFIFQKEKFSKKTIEIFNNKAEEFITKNNIIADVFIDNRNNLQNFYPIITIVFIFQYEFLIYDVFTRNVYTYEKNQLLLNNRQVVSAPTTINQRSLQTFNESIDICRYLMKLTSNIDIDEDSKFYKFINH